jgi:hypothetical protein
MPACLAVPGHCPNQLISPLRAERDNWCVCRDEHVLSFFVFVLRTGTRYLPFRSVREEKERKSNKLGLRFFLFRSAREERGEKGTSLACGLPRHRPTEPHQASCPATRGPPSPLSLCAATRHEGIRASTECRHVGPASGAAPVTLPSGWGGMTRGGQRCFLQLR